MATVEDFKLRITVDGEQNIRKTSETINNLKDDLADLGQVGGPLGGTINGIVGRLGPLGVAASLAGTAFVGLGLSAIRMASELQNIANASGVAASQLQSFRASVIAAGGNAEQYKDIVTDLNKNLQDAASGNKGLQDAFRSLGVFVTDANGRVRETSDVLEDVVGLFRSGRLTAEQYTAATQLLGEGIKSIDITKLEALRDPVRDQEIAQLKEYEQAITRIRTKLEEKVVSFFGGIALDIERAQNKFNELEAELNRQGRTQGTAGERAATGRFGGINPFGIGGPAGSREMTPAEKKAYEDKIKMENALKEAYANRDQEERRLLGRAPGPGGQGGFGAEDPASIKAKETALAASNQRIAQFNRESARSSELAANAERLAAIRMFADERERIEQTAEANIREVRIRSRFQTEQALAEIDARKDLTDEQKELEKAAVRKNIEAQTAGEIINIRNRAVDEANNYDKNKAEQSARERARIEEIVSRSKAVVEQQEKTNVLLEERNKFLQENVTATDRERRNAEELFNLEQERLEVLRQIASIKDLPPDERARREAEINDAFEKRKRLVQEQQAADLKASESFSAGFEKAYRQYAEDAKNNFEKGREFFEKATRGMEDAIVGFAKTGKFEWKSFVNSMLEELLRSQVQSLFSKILGNITTSIGGARSSGGFFDVVGSMLGFANGGFIPTNQPVLVGERGPEILTGAAGRTVIPNNEIGSFGQGVSAQYVTYNISAVDAMSFKQMIARDPSFIHAVAMQGSKNIPTRR